MIRTLDPLEDPRWPAFVEHHPDASIFHTRGWLLALQRSYGYQPIVYTTCAPADALTNGILLSRVRSWVTGRRMVSLPFADHCELLVDALTDCVELLDALRSATDRERWKYLELRPVRVVNLPGQTFETSNEFRLHMLDLRPSLAEILQGTHKSAIQRKIRRAEREGLTYEEGTSEKFLHRFYGLLLLTRRRHGLPPQPIYWFRNLIAFMGNRLKIRVACKNGRPIASIMTLQHGNTIVYKYGCSDADVHNLGAMPFLFWKTIEDAKAMGLERFDFGRSETTNSGLITFKRRWGSTESSLTYLRYSSSPHRRPGRYLMQFSSVWSRLPQSAAIAAGKILYRHMG